ELSGHFHRRIPLGADKSPGPADESHFVGEIREQWVSGVESGSALDIEFQTVCSIGRGECPGTGVNDADRLPSAGGQVNGPFAVKMGITHHRDLSYAINRMTENIR